jgi:long-chain fatty acid transport protein
MPKRGATVMGTDYNSDANVFAIPQIAFTSKIDDKMSWGIMVNAMGGMSTDYRTFFDINGLGAGFDPSRQTVDLSGMMIAPTLSYAVNKDVTLGASLLIGYANLRLGNIYGMNTAVGASATNEGAALAYGVKFGATWKMSDTASFGLVLQPKMSSDELSFFDSFMAAASLGSFTGSSEIVLPTTIGVGAKFAVSKDTNIVADVMQYQWTSVDVFDFFGWEDQTVLKIGVEHRASDKLTLRAGLNYGKSPIDSSVALQNYPFPAVSESHFTVGMGYKLDNKMTVNAYYLYSPETKVDDASGAGSIQMSQNAFGIGINYQMK